MRIECRPLQKLGSALLLTALIAPLNACSLTKSEPVSITVEPPVVKVVTLKNNASSAPLDTPSNHEAARTDWVFSISPELDISHLEEKKESDGWHVWLTVTAARIKLALPITTYLSDRAPKYVSEHENGHVSICRRIYENSREIALNSATKIIGRRFEGVGADERLALTSALQLAGQEIAAPYREKTAGLADRVSSVYDQLCQKEDRRNLVKQSVDEAFSAVSK